MEKALGGIALWGLIVGLLFLIRPRSFIHRSTVTTLTRGQTAALNVFKRMK